MNKEEIEHLQVSYYHLHEAYEKLKQENKQLKERLEEVCNELQEYKEREDMNYIIQDEERFNE